MPKKMSPSFIACAAERGRRERVKTAALRNTVINL